MAGFKRHVFVCLNERDPTDLYFVGHERSCLAELIPDAGQCASMDACQQPSPSPSGHGDPSRRKASVEPATDGVGSQGHRSVPVRKAARRAIRLLTSMPARSRSASPSQPDPTTGPGQRPGFKSPSKVFARSQR